MPAERTVEWIHKAEEDWAVIGLIRAADPGTAPDVLVFLCQQCIEKYLKALLCEEGLAVPRTHDLASLLLELLDRHPRLDRLEERCDELSHFAVAYRYPDEDATPEITDRALEGVEEIRRALRQLLDL